MTYFAEVESNNEVVGLFHDANGNVPDGAIAISDADAQTMISDADGFGYFDCAADGTISKNTERVDALSLNLAIAAKLGDLKSEGLRRFNAAVPGTWSIDQVKFFRELWLSIAASARTPTATFTIAIEVFQAWDAAHDAVAAMTDVATVEAYNVTTDPGWP